MPSLLIRLCVLMVAAFGLRPSGVRTVERTPAPWVIGAETREGVVSHSLSHEPARPSIGLLVRGASAVRTPGASSSGSASSAESLARASVPPIVFSGPRKRIARRTPCAACGDGSPYDATAPPPDMTARA
jgi:hypothetical protein